MSKNDSVAGRLVVPEWKITNLSGIEMAIMSIQTKYKLIDSYVRYISVTGPGNLPIAYTDYRKTGMKYWQCIDKKEHQLWLLGSRWLMRRWWKHRCMELGLRVVDDEVIGSDKVHVDLAVYLQERLVGALLFCRDCTSMRQTVVGLRQDGIYLQALKLADPQECRWDVVYSFILGIERIAKVKLSFQMDDILDLNALQALLIYEYKKAIKIPDSYLLTGQRKVDA